jgi:hypothetical protein
MIDALLSVIKPIDAPGSIPFLVIGLVLGLAVTFVWPRNRRLGRYWLMSLLTFYFLLALPVVAKLISTSLPGPAAVEPFRPGQLDTLVVFDGDNRRGRVATAVEIIAKWRPQEVWVLGVEADWIQDALHSKLSGETRIQVDLATSTTRLQLDWVADRLKRKSGERIALVASRLQVPRIVGMAKAIALDVPIVSAPVDDEPPSTGARLFLPTYLALRVSRDALYEHAAIAYYRSRGWAVP